MDIFEYTAYYIPTGVLFKKRCKAQSRLMFLEWLNAWNHNAGYWVYVANVQTSSVKEGFYPHPILL